MKAYCLLSNIAAIRVCRGCPRGSIILYGYSADAEIYPDGGICKIFSQPSLCRATVLTLRISKVYAYKSGLNLAFSDYSCASIVVRANCINP